MAQTTSTLHCVNEEMAAALAARLRDSCGVPPDLVHAEMAALTAPIDDVGFALFVAGIAVEGGYADERSALAFQQATTAYAEALSGRGQRAGMRTVVVFCDRCGSEVRTQVSDTGTAAGFAAARMEASSAGWKIATGCDLCPGCAPAADGVPTMPGRAAVRF